MSCSHKTYNSSKSDIAMDSTTAMQNEEEYAVQERHGLTMNGCRLHSDAIPVASA